MGSRYCLEEINNEEMFVLRAPNGIIQLTTLATDYETCVGVIELMADAGFGHHYKELVSKHFEIISVIVTIKKI